MIIKKRLQKEFTVEVEGISFTFRMPTHKETIQFGETPHFSDRIDVVIQTLTKISHVEFEDGSTLKKENIFELDDSILYPLYTAWAKAKGEIEEADQKERAAKAVFTSGSASA